jgi:hypothetical protein
VSQFCTGPAFRGVCTPLNGTSCTNTPGIQSLILNPDADCLAFPCVPTLDSRCGGVGWPACGNPSTRWFSIYSTFIFTISYSIVCNVNIANPSSFDHEPPPTRPVQGQAPRGSTELLDPSSRKVASGQSSHPNPSNRTLRRCRLHTAFSHFLTLIFRHFRTLRLGTTSHILFLAFSLPFHGLPTQNKNLQAGCEASVLRRGAPHKTVLDWGLKRSLTMIANPIVVFLLISKASPHHCGTLACDPGEGPVSPSEGLV